LQSKGFNIWKSEFFIFNCAESCIRVILKLKNSDLDTPLQCFLQTTTGSEGFLDAKEQPELVFHME